MVALASQRIPNVSVTTEELLALKVAIERYCIERLPEPVRLASGGFSNYYFDSKLVTLHPAYARTIGRLMLPLVIEAGAEAVGGLATGSIPISCAVAAASIETSEHLPTFFGRPEKKDHGPLGKASLSSSVANDGSTLLRAGRRVAIVDDVITQGGSAMQAVAAVGEEGCTVVVVVSLVERHEGGGARFRERGLAFKRLFYTHEDGSLHIDEEVAARVGAAAS